MTGGAGGPNARGGFALVAVLLVLLALLVLCTPFLMTARNAGESSARIADRAQARLALDAAARHARASLQGSHEALDPTPWYDSAEELHVDNRFAEGFLDASDERGVLWDLEVLDLAGRIDLNSASPQVIANVLDVVAHVYPKLALGDEMLALIPVPGGLDPWGYVWIGRELVHYRGIEGSTLVGLQRGLSQSCEGEALVLEHGLGAPVLEQRAFAPALWRVLTAPAGELARFDSFEQLLELEELCLEEPEDPGRLGEEELEGWRASRGPKFDAEVLLSLSELTSVHAGHASGALWQRPTRLVDTVEGGCVDTIRVEDVRWFTAGSTLRVTNGLDTELRLVREVLGDGRLAIDPPLTGEYQAWEAEVSVLAKRPVNANTASGAVLAALFTNVQLAGRNERVTREEADALAARVLALRPFTGLEDFLRRLLLPAAGIEELPDADELEGSSLAGALISAFDAQALYRNALNANDASLAFATMPLAFASRDLFAFDLRAAVNAPSGVLRHQAARERVEHVVPQRELFWMWTRQHDFDEALRLDREAPWWMSGPAATSRWDGRATVPPSRFWSHFGTLGDAPYVPGLSEPVETAEGGPAVAEHVFASREEAGFAQLWPYRRGEAAGEQGRALHFDHETRHHEGRYLPDETVWRAPDDGLVRWSEGGSDPMLRALSFEAWLRPQGAPAGTILDAGNLSPETDRLWLGFDGPDLVLRVLDAFGDHLATPDFVEAAEARFAIGAQDGPGFPSDVWSHVMVDVRGNRPGQVTLLVNGMAHGVRNLGMTRLVAPLPLGAGTIAVESTEGFPARGVVRIGNELIEYTLAGPTTLLALHEESGPYAGFGGRSARLHFNLEDVPVELDVLDLDHPADATVELYGYSLPLATNVPSGQSQLPDELGVWRVANVRSMSAPGVPVGGNPIFFDLQQVGMGIESTLGGGPAGFDLELDSADNPGRGDASVLSAFHPEGGLAAIVQTPFGNLTDGGSAFGGVEVVRYSGWDGNLLHVVERGINPRLERQASDQQANLMSGAEGRAFVFEWTHPQLLDWNEDLTMLPYVFPISLPVGATGSFSGFLPPGDQSELAQITRLDDAENTEWVRYDEIFEGELVRSDPGALLSALVAIIIEERELPPLRPPPGGGGGGGGGGGFSPAEPPFRPPPARGAGAHAWLRWLAALAGQPSTGALALAGAAPGSQEGVGSTQWDPVLGEEELDSYPLSRAASDALRFRGVLGTSSHAHPAGTAVLPVFRVRDIDPDGERPSDALAFGQPGAGDAVFLAGSSPDELGWPVVVHRAHRFVGVVRQRSWQQDGSNLLALAGGVEIGDPDVRLSREHVYVALREAAPVPVEGDVQISSTDTRLLPRMSKFPSGERPRLVAGVGVGTGFGDGSDASVPSAILDEVVFGDPDFGYGAGGADPPGATQGAQLELLEDLDAGAQRLVVRPASLRVPLALVPTQSDLLDGLPPEGGLLRIGEELLAYQSYTAASGELVLARGGRGLLGTSEQPHLAGESVTLIEHLPAAVLLATVGPADAVLPASGAERFPPEGTLLLGGELVHYTRISEGAFEMPKASTAPGARDHRGAGLFRGRYGTGAGTHEAGTAIVWFPIRYWDRWAAKADAPELSYLRLRRDQPGALWRSFFYGVEPPATGGVGIGVLQRSDPEVPWDEDPELAEGLALFREGGLDGGEIPIGARSDVLEWRVFVEYQAGAFDPVAGRSHSWKATPRLEHLGVSWIAPGRVLRSVDR